MPPRTTRNLRRRRRQRAPRHHPLTSRTRTTRRASEPAWDFCRPKRPSHPEERGALKRQRQGGYRLATLTNSNEEVAGRKWTTPSGYWRTS
jgi:hypothetical protein